MSCTWIYPLVNVATDRAGKIHHLIAGKTHKISGPSSIAMSNYQRVRQIRDFFSAFSMMCLPWRNGILVPQPTLAKPGEQLVCGRSLAAKRGPEPSGSALRTPVALVLHWGCHLPHSFALMAFCGLIRRGATSWSPKMLHVYPIFLCFGLVWHSLMQFTNDDIVMFGTQLGCHRSDGRFSGETEVFTAWWDFF